ncbi:MAG: hypothetical protein KBA31_07670 [Alphaproteobacteria bacterium]|nr:hypothetical protein [Alphaproteobacteria bacterium]
MRIKHTAGLVALCGALGTASAEPAQSLQGTCITNNTYAGTVNECLGPQATPDLRFTSAGPQFNYSVTIQASPMHCSKVGIHVFTYDLRNTLGGTGLLSPGQAQTISIGSGYAAGLQIAKVKAFGWISDTGCNRGFLQSWAATATVVQQ